MLNRLREAKVSSPDVIGALMVLIGLILLLVVFFAVLPVLTDPVGTHDDWFPEDESAAPVDEEPEPKGPTAVFRVDAEASGEEGTRVYEIRLEDRSEPGDAEIVAWDWDLGDGTTATEPVVDHVYDQPGSYGVRLEVTDENGLTSDIDGDVEMPDEGRNSDLFDAGDEIDISGLESAVEDAVDSLERSVDDTLESVVVVVLFALAAIATTVVGWRIIRTGAMLLRPAEGMNLRVRPADMHVEIDGASLHHVVDESDPDG